MKQSPTEPVLRFTPYAWAKLQYFCHRGDTEIGGFGLSHEDDPLLVIDFLTLKQRTTSVTVAFDDEAVADLLDQQVDAGIAPARFTRIWLHTHPGHCAQPSGTDEETFARVFGPCDWAVMAIIARGGETYARLRFNVGPGGQVRVPMTIDYTQPFPAADHDLWETDYRQHVQPVADAFALPSDPSAWAEQVGLDDMKATDQELEPGADELDRYLGEWLDDLDEAEDAVEHLADQEAR